jgi:hypothetical protein
MLAMIASVPPQRAQHSISMPNTRFRHRAQLIATCRGVGGFPGLADDAGGLSRPPAPVRATSGQGEYQIGDVHARSCCFIGTSALIFTPKRAWSYAVQRGVGISITRA